MPEAGDFGGGLFLAPAPQLSLLTHKADINVMESFKMNLSLLSGVFQSKNSE